MEIPSSCLGLLVVTKGKRQEELVAVWSVDAHIRGGRVYGVKRGLRCQDHQTAAVQTAADAGYGDGGVRDGGSGRATGCSGRIVPTKILMCRGGGLLR